MGLLSLFKREQAAPDAETIAPAAEPQAPVAEESSMSPEIDLQAKSVEGVVANESPATQAAPAADVAPAAEPVDIDALRTLVVRAVRTVYDPEIPVNIYDMGLIYLIDIDDARKVFVQMTLTAPNCPSAESLPAEVAEKIRKVPGVTDVQLDLVWEPSWNKDMMSEAARLELGF